MVAWEIHSLQWIPASSHTPGRPLWSPLIWIKNGNQTNGFFINDQFAFFIQNPGWDPLAQEALKITWLSALGPVHAQSGKRQYSYRIFYRYFSRLEPNFWLCFAMKISKMKYINKCFAFRDNSSFRHQMIIVLWDMEMPKCMLKRF